MKDLITHIVKGITGSEDVKVEEVEDGGFTVFTLHAPQDKVGMIIGKEGRTINAIKNIVKVIAIKQNKRISIEIAEN